MDPSTMTFEEVLFHGRYHIIGAIMFAIFFGVFIHEAIREMVAMRAERRGFSGGLTGRPIIHDGMLGATMTDGGEPVEETDDRGGSTD